ncbi:TetR/AcrR family transcriptional regulator [Vibrio sonorensis]|uniref:TetR/AcrR family transcriptional regulator n=1 Tax=Vibrio sonorensis TaxID=1004316 RepID=UPI0008D9B134|nr:TetR/AcrR family transcriptional regulator [Vibrio sonorensis]
MVKVSDIKQEDIIRSAIEVFSQKGFEQASMEGISKQAGVSKRTLYKYYPNKEALFEVIVDKLICRFDDQCRLQFEPSVSVLEQLVAFTVRQMAYMTTSDFQMMARLVMTECMKCPESSKVLMARFASIEDSYGLKCWVQEGIEAGVLTVDDVALAIEQYIGSIKAVVFWPQLLGHLPPPTEPAVRLAVESAAESFVARYQNGE